MDRSRFQNRPSNGSYNKPPQIQSDGVGMKSSPPLILDRFRAMVKEREDELRVFGDEAVFPLSTEEIVRLYEIVLSELTINSKPIITDLTIIAGEQRAHAEGIANAICARIIEVSVDQKLPSLYLLDSIVKNIGKDYIKYFSAHLAEVFREAYVQVHPNMYQAMRHLFGTWASVFPSSVLHKIEALLQFSAPINGQSAEMISSRASESPRPTHGIHINPKYFEAQHQLAGTEGVISIDRAAHTSSGADSAKKPPTSAARITRSSPYRIGLARPSSPSLEEFSVDRSPKRVAIRASPSHSSTGHGLGRVMGREEETSEWQARNWPGNSCEYLKTSAAYKYKDDVDLRGPRALISAYGIDEREKNLNLRNHMAEQLESNSADTKVAIRAWQNTEEEEFDWEDMTPALVDNRQFNESSSLVPPCNLKSGRGSIHKIAGAQRKFVGPNDSTSRVPLPGYTRESMVLPHQQQSRIQLHAKGSSSYLGTVDKFSGPSNTVSTSSSTYDYPAPEIQLASEAPLTKAWRPANFHRSHMLPSFSLRPPQIQTRGRFGTNNAANLMVDQTNGAVYSEQLLSSSRSMAQVNLPQFRSQRPEHVPLNLQSRAQPSLVQPNLMMSLGVRQNLPLSSSVSAPSHAMLPPPSYGFLTPGHGLSICTASSNLVPGVTSSLPNLNAPSMPFHVPGAALHSLTHGPLPGITQPLPIGQVASTSPSGGAALSGLFSSLMAQGLISVAKQDTVGVEFDQDGLKVRHESAITALYNDLPRQCTTCGLRFKSQEEHSKHMDWHVNKNRTLKNRKTKPSPKWFVSVSMWLSGAEAVGTEAVPGFLPTEHTEEKEDKEMAVPADEEQNACALCGEPFEDFYSDEMEEWMYKGAVYMYAPVGGSTVGIDRSQLGPIVHAKCRSDSHESPSEGFEKDEWEPTEEGSQRKRLRI